MKASIQIIGLIFSYGYGSLSFFLFLLHKIIIKNKKKFYQSLTSILFIYNIVLFYIIVFFRLNNGKFHIYFLIMGGLGFCFTDYLTKRLSNNVNLLSFIEKLKNKWYTKKK